MTSVPTAQSRTAWGLMRDRTFGPYVTGNVVSSCGNWIQQIAAAVLMFQLTRSAFIVGAVSMVLFAGPLLLALWTGVLSDRRDRRRVLMVGRGITCLAVGVLAVLINKDLEQALALASVAPSIARTVGPAGGAGLLLLGGPALAFAVAAATHGLFVLAMFWVRARRQQREAGRPRMLGGIQYLRRDRTAAMLMVGIAQPLAAPVNGAVADATSVTAAMLAAAAVVLAASLLVRVQHTDS